MRMIPSDTPSRGATTIFFSTTEPSLGDRYGLCPQEVQKRLGQVDTLVIEANYDEALLDQDTKRPWSVKQRIRGRHGHLSNQDVLSLLKETEAPVWKNVFLVHLSRDCNCKDHLRSLLGKVDNFTRNYKISIIDPDEFCPKPVFF